jgi:holin-like protein
MIDYFRGFGILVGFFLLGILMQRLGVPIPGGVLGLILFYLAMSLGLVKVEWVERAAGLLLRHMVLLFVPVTVGLIELGPVLSKQALPIIASLLVSLVAVLLTTGLLGKWLLPEDPAASAPISGHKPVVAATGSGQ